MGTARKRVQNGMWASLCACLFATATMAGDLPALDELLAINAASRACLKAGEIAYVLDRQDVADGLAKMEEERIAQIERQIEEQERELDSERKEATLSMLEDQLEDAPVLAVVMHTLRYGSFQIHLRFDHGKKRVLAVKEDGRDLVAIMGKAGTKPGEGFGF